MLPARINLTCFPELGEEMPESTMLEAMATSAHEMLYNTNYSCGMAAMSVPGGHPNIDDIAITITNNQGGVTFNFNCTAGQQDQSSRVSSLTSDFLARHGPIPWEEGHKLRHELICSYFSTAGSDTRLRDIYGVETNKTPDFVFRVYDSEASSESTFDLVIEVSSVTRESHYYERYTQKVMSYNDVLESISANCGRRIFLAIVIVTPNTVLSNVYVSEEDAKCLCALWVLGERMFRMGRDRGFFKDRPLTEENQLSETATKIKASIEGMEMKNPCKIREMTITTEYARRFCIKTHTMEEAEMHFSSTITRLQPEVIRLARRTPEEIHGEFAEGLNRYEQVIMAEPTRQIYKSIINMPLIDVDFCETNKEIYISNPKSSLQNVWYKGLLDTSEHIHRMTNEEKLIKLNEEAYATSEVLIEKLQGERLERRKERVDSQILGTISEDVDSYLHRDGAWAKGVRDSLVLAKKADSKIPLSLECPTGDIEEFIKNDLFFSPSLNEMDDRLEDCFSLIDKADELTGNSSVVPLNVTRLVTRTSGFSALLLASEIMTEVAAHLNHHVKKGHAIVKKLVKRSVYLMIIPTKSREHIFFSVFISRRDHPNARVISGFPFREPEETTDGWFYPFVSYKQHKFKNVIISPYLLISLFSYYNHFEEIPLSTYEETDDLLNLDHKVRTLVLFNMLVALEDKSATEELITLNRYVLMDLINTKGRINIVNPCRFITKLPTFFRSRLQLFVYKRLTETWKQMTLFPPEKVNVNRVMTKEESDDAARDNFRNVINFITLDEMKSSWKIVQLMYIGYSVNKDKIPEGNSDVALVSKLMTIIRKVEPASVSRPGLLRPGEPIKPLQFSENNIAMGARLLADKLRHRMGEHYKNVIANDICDELSKKMTHEIATLKASMHTGVEVLNLLDPDPQVFEAKKLLETIHLECDRFGLNPFKSIDKIIELLENPTMGLVFRLFKKNQHAGLREISIMEVNGRIVALFLETISRQICRQFDNEILTHPENKLSILEAHKVDVREKARLSNGVVTESSNTSDKTKWNQNLSLHSLIIALLELTPPSFHAAIVRAANLWVGKHILIPESVIKLLKEGTHLSNEEYEDLLQQYKGNKDPRFISVLELPGSKFLNIQSGMQQGILHYTSSLLHLCTMTLVSKLVTQTMKKMGYESRFDAVVSSDDSASILSCVVNKTTSLRQLESLKVKMDVIMIASEEFTRTCSMRPSEKSLLCASNCIEFNSEFLIGNNLVVPTIKHILASLNMSEAESFESRFDQFYNLLSDVFSKGLPAQNTTVCQLSQALLHYASMGALNNLMFSDYAEKLVSYPEPTLGFFPLDTTLCPGLLGLSYSMFLCRKNSGIVVIPSKVVSSTEITLGEGGYMSESLLLKMGDSKRHQKLIKELSSGLTVKEAEDYINSKPRLLYLLPLNESEAHDKLIIKALAPGVANSLKHGNDFVKAFQSTVYSLFTHCFTKTETVKVDGKLIKVHSKVTLPQEISRRIELKELYPEDFVTEGSPPERLCLVFPNHRLFTILEDVFSKIQSQETKLVLGRRFRRSYVNIPTPTYSSSIRLLNLVRHVWFGVPLNASAQRIERCWQEQLNINPWLRKNIEEALHESPFSSHISMFYYISSFDKKNRRVVMNCPPIRASRLKEQILAIVRRCYGTNQELVSSKSTSHHMDTQLKYTRLFLATNLFTEVREEACRAIMNSIKVDESDLANLDSMHYKEAETTLMVAFHNKVIDKTTLLNMLLRISTGMIVSYEARQVQRHRRDYTGEGSILLSARELHVRLIVKDDKVTQIQSNNREKLKLYASLIAEKMRELRVEFSIHNQTKSNRVPVYVNGTITEHMNGVPYIDMVGHVVGITPEQMDLRVEVQPGEICLMQFLPSGAPPLKIRSVKTFDVCSGHQDQTTPANTFIEAWVSNTRLNLGVAESILTTVKATPVGRRTEADRFMIDTFRRRFNWKYSSYQQISDNVFHLRTYAPAQEISYDLEEIQDIETEAMRVITEMTLEIMKDMPATNEDWSDIADFEFDSDFFSFQHEFNNKVTSRVDDNYRALHHIWDTVIDRLRPRDVLDSMPTSNEMVAAAREFVGRSCNYAPIKKFSGDYGQLRY